MKAAWPTGTEVTNRLTGLGVTSIPTGVTIADIATAAKEAFERDSGYVPFLEEASPVTMTYDPPYDYVLSLIGGMTDVDSVEVDGTAQTLGTDFWLEPVNARIYDQPYTRIRFASPIVGDPQSIEVVGKRGYNDEIPGPAWEAVMALACQMVIMVKNGYIGPLTESKSGLVSMKYAGDDAGTMSQLQMAYDNGVARYRRMVVC